MAAAVPRAAGHPRVRAHWKSSLSGSFWDNFGTRIGKCNACEHLLCGIYIVYYNQNKFTESLLKYNPP
jgi:hypothetical protein